MINIMQIHTFHGHHADVCSLDPKSASLTLAKLQNDTMSDFEGITKQLKEVYKGQSAYHKALEKVRSQFNILCLQKSNNVVCRNSRINHCRLRNTMRCLPIPH